MLACGACKSIINWHINFHIKKYLNERLFPRKAEVKSFRALMLDLFGVGFDRLAIFDHQAF